jgi:hypothetical protein
MASSKDSYPWGVFVIAILTFFCQSVRVTSRSSRASQLASYRSTIYCFFYLARFVKPGQIPDMLTHPILTFEHDAPVFCCNEGAVVEFTNGHQSIWPPWLVFNLGTIRAMKLSGLERVIIAIAHVRV